MMLKLADEESKETKIKKRTTFQTPSIRRLQYEYILFLKRKLGDVL